MKRILFITAFPPSNIGAGVNYTRLLLNDISSFAEVDVVYISDNSTDAYVPPHSNIEIVKVFKINKIKKLIHSILLPFLFPLFSAKFSIFWCATIKKILRTKDYDCVYFDFSQMFLYSKFLRPKNAILMSHDVIAQRYSRKNKLIGKWAKLTEKWILKNRNNHIFTFSNKDSDLLLRWYNINSTPTSFYFSNYVKLAQPTHIDDYFVFFAMWKRPDNYEGLDWFLETALTHLPNFKAKIIGSGLPAFIKDKIAQHKGLEYLGFIDNPYPIIANSKGLISPLFHGAGVKVKVLDALASGTPVIGTSISFEGISSDYNDLTFEANTPLDFVSIIKAINVHINDRLAIKNRFLEQTTNKEIISYLKTI